MPNPNLLVYSHSRPRGRQELLQSALPSGRSQLVGQQREDGMGAPQTHTVHHHRLYWRQLRLVVEKGQKYHLIQVPNTAEHFLLKTLKVWKHMIKKQANKTKAQTDDFSHNRFIV